MAAPLLFQSLGTRTAILACFWVALLASIPWWLRLTTIQRLPLPAQQVRALQQFGSCPVTLQSSLVISVDADILREAGADADRDARTAFLKQVEQLVQQSLEIKSQLPAAASLECTRWKVQVQSSASEVSPESFQPETGAYVVRIASEASAESTSSQPPRIPTIYIPAISEDSESLPLVPDTLSAAVIAELVHLRGDKPLTDDDTSTSTIAVTEQDPRVIQYSKHVRLVFSIMNQDITDGTAYDSRLLRNLADGNASADNPISKLTRALSQLHDFHIETQVQWFAPLHFQPTMEQLEEVVEMEVEEEVMVDQEIQEEVDVEVDDVADVADVSQDKVSASETHPTAGDQHELASNGADAEAAEVERQLSYVPQIKRTRTLKQVRKRTIQVPRIQRIRKQKRTPLPPRHVVEWDDLKVFVNSQEWSLTSTVPPCSSSPSERAYDVLSQTHDLHFLLYIPSKSHSPLMIRDTVHGGVKEDVGGWLIPQWGGVVIVNVDHEEKQSTGLVKLDQKLDRGGVEELAEIAVAEAMALFARQLEILLGLSDGRSASASLSETQDRLQRRVQLSTLKQRRILELSREATSTLIAITRLVDRIENLGVGAHVKSDVEAALHIMHSLRNSSSNAHLDELLDRAAQAYALSNRAFFNPDMLGLLYFPDEHKYAVYTPLFAPLLVPLFVTTLKLIKQLVARRKPSTKSAMRASKPSTYARLST